jgi:hypothetical protein
LSTPSPYELVPRTKHQKTGKALSGFALDLTVRANKDGAYFLQDLNNAGVVMPHNNVLELLDTLVRTIGQNHVAYFGHPRP